MFFFKKSILVASKEIHDFLGIDYLLKQNFPDFTPEHASNDSDFRSFYEDNFRAISLILFSDDFDGDCFSLAKTIRSIDRSMLMVYIGYPFNPDIPISLFDGFSWKSTLELIEEINIVLYGNEANNILRRKELLRCT